MGLVIKSPVTPMYLSQVIVTLSRRLIRSHFVSITLETHTYVATSASHPVTSISSNHRHVAILIRTKSASALNHILLKVFVGLAHLHHVFAFYSRMKCFLNRN